MTSSLYQVNTHIIVSSQLALGKISNSDFLNSIIDIQFVYRKIHPLKMYNSLVFSIFTRLYSHHHYLIPERFCHPPKETMYPLAVILHSSLLHPQPQKTTSLHSVSVDLPVLDISCKWVCSKLNQSVFRTRIWTKCSLISKSRPFSCFHLSHLFVEQVELET